MNLEILWFRVTGLMASVRSDSVVSGVLLKIGEVRLARGVSQEKLAELSGIDLGVISRAERLQRIPSMAAIMDLASALELDFAELVRGARKSNEP
ncbi:MAG: helix-turn-helix transcriptional regulator [Luteolibacter sp.]